MDGVAKRGHNKVMANKEGYQRINFLYQAAHVCLQQSPTNPEMCRFYIYTLRSIAEKHILRLHPDMKRTICKKCCMLLLPGITSISRNKKKGDRYTVVSCLECGSIKRYPWKTNYKLWVEKPEAWQTS